MAALLLLLRFPEKNMENSVLEAQMLHFTVLDSARQCSTLSTGAWFLVPGRTEEPRTLLHNKREVK